jgi:Holliday junction resolvase-like predicted endonuclease
LRAALEIRLLELTRATHRTTLNQLAEQLHIQPIKLAREIEDLAERKLVSRAHESLQIDTAQRMMLATELIYTGRDPQQVSRFLEWQEFETFAAECLERNEFRTIKHLLFMSRIGRREIDLLAWNDSFLLAIDCKHWMRSFSPSISRRVAHAQAERVEALAGRVEILKRHGVEKAEKRVLIPVILCLSEPRARIVDGIPIVQMSRFISFLSGISPIDEGLRWIPIGPQREQSLLA